MISTMVKSPRENAQTKIEHVYTGPQDTGLAESMINCDSEVSDCHYERSDCDSEVGDCNYKSSD